MTDLKIITNNQPREIIYYWDLAEEEKEDYDWASEEDTFFRYKGNLYCLGEFMRTGKNSPFGEKWEGYHSDSAFGGILIRYYSDGYHTYDDFVVVGFYMS